MSALTTAAEETEARYYSLPDHGVVQLRVPKSWQEKIAQPPNRLPPTIIFSPASGTAFQILATTIWSDRPNVEKPNPEFVKKVVQDAADRALGQSIETSIKLEKLNGPSTYGYYFFVTDKAPKPDEFKYVTQGMFQMSDLHVTFTVLTNDGAENIVPASLEMFQGATYTPQK